MKVINRKVFWLILSLLAFSFPIFAQEKPFDESVLSENGKQAYQTLLKTELYAMDGIGYSGKASEGREALYELLKEGKIKSILAFKSLVKDANINGALYGLVGLKMWRCDCFQEELKNFKLTRLSDNNKEILSYQSGCYSPSNYKTAKDKNEFFDFLFEPMLENWAR